MINLTDKQIKNIAEDLDCGFICYYNKRTGEIKNMLDMDSWDGADEELWEEDQKELEENSADYIEFEGFESRESFIIMEDFAETVDDSKLRDSLINALNKRKPFANFKWQIDNSGDYRQQWFDYKNKRYIEHVKDQLEQYNSMEDDE